MIYDVHVYLTVDLIKTKAEMFSCAVARVIKLSAH